jgi:hypothetical protein
MFQGSNPGGGKFSATFQTGPVVQTASYTMGKREFLGISGQGVALTIYPNLILRLKKE